MKKSILQITAIVIALTNTHNSFAQKMFATLQVGYGIASGVSTANSITTLVTRNGASPELTYVKQALGKGVNIGGSIGYFFHKNIGIELGINYLMGGKSTIGEIDGTKYYNTNTYYGNFVNFKPSLVLQLPLKSLNLYSKFGLLGSIGSVNNHYELKQGSENEIRHTKSSGGNGSGITSALGINLKVNKQIALLLEINNSNGTFSPAKDEVIEYNINGVNILGDLETFNKKYEYVSTLIITSATPSPNLPRQIPKPAYSIGNTSFNIGLRFNF